MSDKSKYVTKCTVMDICFVCKNSVVKENSSINKITKLPVCNNCKDSDKEKSIEKKAVESLAEDFTCGCI
ncbi:hypothetical protein QA597_08325 [Marinilabiliaceae bacterium ANBcel2]|nr:hypothetical protein [Marinilabiliaceae bacterium ANBcel2]